MSHSHSFSKIENMTSPAKQTGSRWGSFLSQAVGGLESRLDIILAEGQEGQGNKPVSVAAAKPEPGMDMRLLLIGFGKS